MYDFDNIINRQKTKSEKWDTLESREHLPFTVADTDFAVAPPILEALAERLAHPVLGYTTLEDSFYEAICAFARRQHGFDLDRSWIHITPGVMVGVGVAIDALTREGDGIIIQTPVYTPFFRVIEKNKRTLITNPLKLANGRFTIDFEDLEEGMKKAKVLLLCNPHNPTGRVFTREELDRMAALAESYGVLIISDEIHSDILYSGSVHIPIATISDYARERSITMIAPSKTFNIPGLSTSVAIIPNPQLRQTFLTKLKALGLHEGNTFGVEALEAAYTLCDPWLEELKAYLEKNRDLTARFLKEKLPEVRLSLPEGTYLMWLDFSAYGDHRDILASLIRNNVVLTDGLIYGEEGLGYLRLNIGCPRATLEEGLSRIEKAVKECIHD